MNDSPKPYTGQALQTAQPDYDENGERIAGKVIAPYIPSKELVKAVEYARLLNRPLLLRGEPGCGKTRLAQAVAYELYGPDYRRYYFEWNVKSTEKATDGLYSYDHLARLRDVQDPSGSEKAKDEYLTFGPMGKAFQTDDCPAVLLIDEVDKANIDFPNDLLLELDQKRFTVKELQEGDSGKGEVVAKYAPIVFITSNDERNLPNAFLRRCVFHYITMSKQLWIDILKARFGQGTDNLSDQDIGTIVNRFEELVTAMKNGRATKVPDTSELLDWTQAIHHYWLKGKKEEKVDLEDQLKGLPFEEVLLKTLEDKTQYQVNTP